MGFVLGAVKFLASLALAFVGYFIMAAEGWPQPYQDMHLERGVVGGLILLLGLLCAVAVLKPEHRRKTSPSPPNEPAALTPAAQPAAKDTLAFPRDEAVVDDEPGLTLAAPAPGSSPPSDSDTAELIARGDRLHADGQAEAALEPYSQALELARRAHAADPGSAEASRALAGALKTNADVYDELGRLDAAIELYEQALTLSRGLAADGRPADRRALSLVIERLADCRESRGHRSRALDLYRQSLSIAESLSRSDPGNSLYAEDLAATRRRIDELESQMALA